MADPPVSIIILTYKNGLGNVKRCLNSLSRISYKRVEIILVDNASEDDTVEYVKRKFPEVKIIVNKKNLGFCEGNNKAVKKANGKYICFLNNDTQVSRNFLKPLINDLEENKNIGVVQPKIRQLVNKKKLDACASYVTSTGFLYHYGYSQRQDLAKYNKPLYMYSVKGACFLVRREIIDNVGLFDKDYFAYFEETDFCHRVWLAGYKVLYEPSSEIFHLGGVDTEASPAIQFHSFKNRIATYIKNFENKTLLMILPTHILICLAISVLYLFKGKFLYSMAIISAIFWNLININKVISKRLMVQRNLKKMEDKNLLPEIKKNAKLSYYKHFLTAPRSTYNFDEI